jgi:hypothetical protein
VSRQSKSALGGEWRAHRRMPELSGGSYIGKRKSSGGDSEAIKRSTATFENGNRKYEGARFRRQTKILEYTFLPLIFSIPEQMSCHVVALLYTAPVVFVFTLFVCA